MPVNRQRCVRDAIRGATVKVCAEVDVMRFLDGFDEVGLLRAAVHKVPVMAHLFICRPRGGGGDEWGTYGYVTCTGPVVP